MSKGRPVWPADVNVRAGLSGRRKSMTTLVFALLVLVILTLFLAFALAVTAALLGNRGVRDAVTNLFRSLAKSLGNLLPR